MNVCVTGCLVMVHDSCVEYLFCLEVCETAQESVVARYL